MERLAAGIRNFVALPDPQKVICSDDWWEKSNSYGPKFGEVVTITHVGKVNNVTYYRILEYSDAKEGVTVVYVWHSFESNNDTRLAAEIAGIPGIRLS